MELVNAEKDRINSNLKKKQDECVEWKTKAEKLENQLGEFGNLEH